MSSILRLDLYVGIYSLTYWRVAAFVWMGLVAAGLALIIVRIALGKSNQWLLSANLLTLSVTLYACCYINFAGLIAGYNVDHSLEMTGQGVPSMSGICARSVRPPSRRSTASRPSCTSLQTRLVRNCLLARRRRGLGIAPARRTGARGRFRDWRLLRYLDQQDHVQ